MDVRDGGTVWGPSREDLLLEQAAEMVATAGRALRAAQELFRLAAQEHTLRRLRQHGTFLDETSGAPEGLRTSSSRGVSDDGNAGDDGEVLTSLSIVPPVEVPR